MLKTHVLYILVLFTVLLCPQNFAKAAETNAFILHSYHQEYPWTKRENNGIVETLQTLNPESDITFSTEYLDTKRVQFSTEYQEFFAKYLETKYAGLRPDIVFVTDDNALEFITNHRSRIFPTVPVVFCGVNDTSFITQHSSDDIYGVFEEKDITANLQLVKKLFPGIENVTFIGDNSQTYEVIYRQILAAAALDFPQYDLSFVAHRNLNQVENLIRATSNTVLVLTTIGGFHDNHDQVLSISTTLKRLRALGEYAIISMEDVYMHDGILGGVTTSGKTQGGSAAELASQLLEGRSISDAKHYVTGENIPTFDHRELVRLNIPESRLPHDSIIVNKPLSIYEEFKDVIISAFLTFLILCTLISFLLISIVRRKKAEEDLKSSRNFLNSVLDNLPDMVFVKEAENLTFVSLNKASEAFFNEPTDNVIGKTDYDFFTKQEADFFTSIDRKVLTSKKFFEIPSEPIRTSSGQRHLHTKKIPILDDNNKPIFLLGISRDITNDIIAAQERVELENKLKQSQKMESIGTLAGGIAHDFNNILSSIIGYTELAQHQPDVTPGVKKLLDGTLKGAERAKQLVRQILTFSRKNEQDRKPVVLADIVQESLTLLKSTLPSTIDIKHEIYSRGKILADPTQMHQVIMNLCTNGYQAMQGNNGILRVRLQEIDDKVYPSDGKFSDFPMGPYLHLTVTDCGKGMSKELLERIFDPYFTTKGPESGTGLGLAVVHGIIKSHGGHIVVESEKAQGTTVNVYLPKFDNTEEETENTANQQPVHSGSKNGELILLVDDEPDLINLTTSYLTNYGYRVHSFSDSQKALDQIKKMEEHYAVVITDMTMPNLTGVELAQEITALSPSTKVILCTGYSDKINRMKALSMGMSEYLEKPVSINEMLAALDKVLSK
ncbi:response regulator [Desulfosediminicola flagellatus]|uniref:hybrid sensor histidine kinase/response regulator n=1 Tax=Desulfosediminicola flagellatus TaxID=2569541 RepID=UPI00142EE1A9|nr:response regulator [Desulfosediminicola flagellatus]